MGRLARITAALFAALLVLAACAPTSEAERLSVEQLRGEISYYPQEAGAIWQYLPSEARLDEPRLYSAVEGPTVLEGEIWIAWRYIGLGFDNTYYRQYRPDGVYLRRKVQPGTIFTFDPPIREFPEPGTLRIGASWSGATTVRAEFPSAPPANRRATAEVDYVYTVVDRRTVTVPAGEFEVFVINFVTRTFGAEGDVVDELVQEVWYAPFIGEVRTENGYFLVEANFLAAPAPAPAAAAP